MSWSWGDVCECGHRRGNHAYDQPRPEHKLRCLVPGCKFQCEMFRLPMKYRTKALPGEIEAYREETGG